MAPPDDRWGQSRFHAIRTRFEQAANTPGWRGWTLEFLLFGFKQGWACLFGALMLALLLGTHLIWPADAHAGSIRTGPTLMIGRIWP